MSSPLYAAVLLIAGVLVALMRFYRPKSTSKCPMQLPDSKMPVGKENTETALYKKLYHEVQNLEDYPEILPTARKTLVSLLRQSVLVTRLQDPERNVLNIVDYTPEKLAVFMAAKRNDTHVNWTSYLARRDAGGGPEMFVDREAAREWLKENAPLQLVDGAWVARVHNVTTPFGVRHITKDAWQTYCEELGDGDIEKNHCYIYRELMTEIGYNFPDQNSIDFLDPKYGLDNDRIWRAGAGHLLISLFPNDFLPEILGFNLHYESLAPQTLKAARELPEWGISGYYFAVHICIDNADSGHSAMAEAAIRRYIEHVTKTGEMDPQEAWKRIQAGYLLSEYLDGDDDLNKYKDAVAEMVHSKAAVAGEVHCSSRARIGGRKLTEWFSKDVLAGNSTTWKDEFIAALARSKPWVYAGDSERGLLLQELSWKGRMFGAFTSPEIQCLRTWIELLDNSDAAGVEDRYWKLVGRTDDGWKTTSNAVLYDAAITHPAFPPQQALPITKTDRHEFVPMAPLNLNQVKLENLLPLWFTHPCILEQVVMSPYRTTLPMGSVILQLLRVESGYRSESLGIAGLDEQRNPGNFLSVTALGVHMAAKHGLPEPTCLKDVLRSDEKSSPAATEFAYELLSWAARPASNEAFLLGLSRAFLDLESWVSNNDALLGKAEREILKKMVARKEVCFEGILAEIQAKPGQTEKFVTAYEFGRQQIERLL